MNTEILVKRTGQLFELPMLKSHLRVTSDEHDTLLTYLMTVATDWVENELGKTLLTQRLRVMHDNNSFCLPFGPVQKVLRVIYNKKEISPNDFSLEPQGDSLKITVPFRWKTSIVDVIYEAGFGNASEDVPSSLRHAVLGTIEYLYRHKGDLNALKDQTTPWLRAYRSYRII